MSRPLTLLLIVVAVLLAIVIGLAALDREVPITRVEVPVTNAAAH